MRVYRLGARSRSCQECRCRRDATRKNDDIIRYIVSVNNANLRWNIRAFYIKNIYFWSVQYINPPVLGYFPESCSSSGLSVYFATFGSRRGVRAASEQRGSSRERGIYKPIHQIKAQKVKPRQRRFSSAASAFQGTPAERYRERAHRRVPGARRCYVLSLYIDFYAQSKKK